MLQSNSLSQSSSSTESITTDKPDYKEKSQATPNASLVETNAATDFLSMSDDDLFGPPDENSIEIEGSLERLEGLLQPMEDGLNSSFKLSEPPTGNMIDSSCNATCHCTKGQLERKVILDESSSAGSDGLVQSAEIISRLSSPEFMDLLEQYAFYASDDCWDFDRFPGEVVPTNYTEYESSREERDEDTDKDSVSHSVKDASDKREETPASTLASSASPPSEGLISTPTDDGPSVVKLDRRTAQTDQTQNANDLESVSLRPRKRKRDHHIDNTRSSSSDSGRNSNGTADGRGNARNIKGKAKITGSNPLSTGFIIYRFGLKPVHSASRRWSCPFPAHDALSDGRCLSTFDAGTIRSHIADHVDAYLAQHPGGKLECPRHRTNERCMWADDRGSLKTVGPNTGLPRHVTEVHLPLRNLAVKRTESTIPGYVSVDDPGLVDEEKRWLRSMGGHAEEEEDDRGEGSSKGVKRTRRFKGFKPTIS